MSVLDLTSMILGNQVQEFRIQWYFVPGSQDAYCVGSDGSVWSRYVRGGRGWVIGGLDDWRELKLRRDRDGYPRISLRFTGVLTTFSIHQLVASLFLGPCPPGLECCHEDGSRDNNHVCNLRYDTTLNNQHDRLKHGTHSRGERGSNVFLTQDLVDLIREEYATRKYTQRRLGEKHGVTRSNIGYIVRNQIWVQY